MSNSQDDNNSTAVLAAVQITAGADIHKNLAAVQQQIHNAAQAGANIIASYFAKDAVKLMG